MSKKQEMKACFECFAEKGLHGTGISAVAEYAGISKATLYVYFSDLDQLIIESTAYCMSKVEDEFMEKAPQALTTWKDLSMRSRIGRQKRTAKNIG